MGGLKAEAVAQIKEICSRYKDENTPLMMILSDIQNEYGYIPLDVQEIVSQKENLTAYRRDEIVSGDAGRKFRKDVRICPPKG